MIKLANSKLIQYTIFDIFFSSNFEMKQTRRPKNKIKYLTFMLDFQNDTEKKDVNS